VFALLAVLSFPCRASGELVVVKDFEPHCSTIPEPPLYLQLSAMSNNEQYMQYPMRNNSQQARVQPYSVPQLHQQRQHQNMPMQQQVGSNDMSFSFPYPPVHYPAIKRRRRLTPEETKILLDVYERTQKPNSAIRSILAAQLNMSSRAVQVWFQNRRAKSKKDSLVDGKDDKNDDSVDSKNGSDDNASDIKDYNEPNSVAASPQAVTETLLSHKSSGINVMGNISYDSHIFPLHSEKMGKL
jgi:ribosomal protein S12